MEQDGRTWGWGFFFRTASSTEGTCGSAPASAAASTTGPGDMAFVLVNKHSTDTDTER